MSGLQNVVTLMQELWFGPFSFLVDTFEQCREKGKSEMDFFPWTVSITIKETSSSNTFKLTAFHIKTSQRRKTTT